MFSDAMQFVCVTINQKTVQDNSMIKLELTKHCCLPCRYCGKNSPPVTRDREITVLFHTDSGVSAAGFQATYTFLHQSEGRDTCAGLCDIVPARGEPQDRADLPPALQIRLIDNVVLEKKDFFLPLATF